MAHIDRLLPFRVSGSDIPLIAVEDWNGNADLDICHIVLGHIVMSVTDGHINVGNRFPAFPHDNSLRAGYPRSGGRQLSEDVMGRAVEHLSLFGQDQSARVTVKELYPQIGFERADLTAHR